jgi:hypothetical protein
MTGIAIQKFRPANLVNVRIQQISFDVPESLKNTSEGTVVRLRGNRVSTSLRDATRSLLPRRGTLNYLGVEIHQPEEK